MSKKRMQKMELKKPVISGFFCTDHDPIEEWVPKDPFDVDFYLDIYLGPDERPSGEFFTVHVLTVKRVRQMRNFKKMKYVIMLEEYSWDTIYNKIDEILEECRGHDWLEMTDKLREHFHWEYEGMK